MEKHMNNHFEKMEETLADIRMDAENFRWGKDAVGSAVDILRATRRPPLVWRRQFLQSLVMLLLVCNMVQRVFLIRGRNRPQQTGPSERGLTIALPPETYHTPDIPSAVPGKTSLKETVLTANGNSVTGITPEEGLTRLLELYRLFETLSPAIALPENQSPSREDTRDRIRGKGEYHGEA